MKWLFLSILLFMGGCQKANTILVISITSHPQGGKNIGSLSCLFQGELQLEGGGMFGSKDIFPITAKVEWWWEDGYHTNAQVVQTETVTFTKQSPTLCNTIYSAPQGYILLNYYWVRIRWVDKDMIVHATESFKAYCYTLKKEPQKKYIKK